MSIEELEKVVDRTIENYQTMKNPTMITFMVEVMGILREQSDQIADLRQELAKCSYPNKEEIKKGERLNETQMDRITTKISQQANTGSQKR